MRISCMSALLPTRFIHLICNEWSTSLETYWQINASHLPFLLYIWETYARYLPVFHTFIFKIAKLKKISSKSLSRKSLKVCMCKFLNIFRPWKVRADYMHHLIWSDTKHTVLWTLYIVYLLQQTKLFTQRKLTFRSL